MAQAQRTPSFESILDTPVARTERPKPMPIGTYDCIVKGMYEEGVSNEKKTPFVRFTYTFQSAGDDVDESDLQAILTDKDGVVHPLSEKSIKDTYYITPDSMFRLKNVLIHMGLVDPDLEDESIHYRHVLSDTPNASIRVYIGHRPGNDGQSVFAEVKRTMPVD